MSDDTDLYPTVPGDRRAPLPHPSDTPPLTIIGDESGVFIAMGAALDRGLAALLLHREMVP